MSFIFSPIKQKYLYHSRRFINSMESTELPSCVNLICNIVIKSLKQRRAVDIPQNPKRAAETAVYRIALNLFDSPQYRLPLGTPDRICEQLAHICRSSLDYFLEVGYISQEEFDEHCDYLKYCDLHFERYSVI